MIHLQIIPKKLYAVFNLFLFGFSIIGCGKLGEIGSSKKGSLVHSWNGVVSVTNLSTKKEVVFNAIPFDEGGVSVSTNGTIAQMQEREKNPEGVYIQINKLNGTFIQEFTHAQDLSFVSSGVRISPNAKMVAFALNMQPANGPRVYRVFAYDLKTLKYTFWDNLNNPGWTADNRLLAVNTSGSQIFLSNTAVDFMDPIGPKNLDRVNFVEGAPDTDYVLFSNNAGVPLSFSMKISTGNITQLLSESTGQFMPIGGGGSLFYVQECCKLNATLPAIHQIPLSYTKTKQSPIGSFMIKNSAGQTLRRSGRYGYTPATL
jgi:hypothetical protein